MYDIPETGFLRLAQVLSVIPLGKTSWWEGVRSGRLVKLSPRCTAWRVEDIRELIKNLSDGAPNNYSPAEPFLQHGLRRYSLYPHAFDGSLSPRSACLLLLAPPESPYPITFKVSDGQLNSPFSQWPVEVGSPALFVPQKHFPCQDRAIVEDSLTSTNAPTTLPTHYAGETVGEAQPRSWNHPYLLGAWVVIVNPGAAGHPFAASSSR